MKKRIAILALALVFLISSCGEVGAKTKTLMSMFPVIDYPATGTGKGPGANFIKGINYENLSMSSRHSLGDINWWELTTWKADNGVVLKVVPADSGYAYGVVPVFDGCGKDLMPGSAYMLAVSECRGEAEYWGKKKNDMKFLKRVATEVPEVQISAASKKRKSIDIYDNELLGYKAAYESIMNSTGVIEGDFLFGETIAMHRDSGGGTWWSISYNQKKKVWVVQISRLFGYQYPWDGIKNILKYISPDGEALYDAIYDDFYLASEDNPIEKYNEWFKCGKKSKIKRYTKNVNGYVYYIR